MGGTAKGTRAKYRPEALTPMVVFAALGFAAALVLLAI